MNNFDIWLTQRYNDFEWIPLKNYRGKYNNKIFRIFIDEEEQIGEIIEKKNDNIFLVNIDYCFSEINLFDFNCEIDKGPITNRDFCINNAYKYINYINNSPDIYLNISEKKFIYDFAILVYENSTF